LRPNLRVKRKLVVEPIGLEIEQLSRPFDPERLFGNDHPLELEIGSGKGTFLTRQAKARPQVNFLGLERARKYWQYSSDRLRRNGCFNARLVLADAGRFVDEYLPGESLAAVHIYFPDPWPKKRHHKRRLIQGPFLLQLERALVKDARVQVITDHEEYFHQIERLIRLTALKVADYQSPGSAEDVEIVGSNFERKYRREGRPLYTIAAVKTPPKRIP
jgi:tRNA (guanine-N7-)-methyltransferase